MKYLIKHYKVLTIISWMICGLIAVLQFNHVHAGILVDYGDDFFAPIMIYYWARVNNRFFIKLPKKPGRMLVSIGLLSFCIIWELRQFYSPDYGTFDLADIIVYVLAIFICYLIDCKVEKVTRLTANNKVYE